LAALFRLCYTIAAIDRENFSVTSPTAKPLTAAPATPLHGQVRVPGDKSISHRALILGALAVGETRITGLLEGQDVLNTAAALRACGAGIDRQADGTWLIHGLGVGGLHEPAHVLDMGNSGTAARLLMGVLASHPFASFLDGDVSLNSRPMNRVADPLRQMGAQVITRSEGRMPLAIVGTNSLLPIRYVSPVPSAQVKSAVLLAGLNAPGETTVVEARPTRDHTENMLRHFGAMVRVEDGGEGRAVTVAGQPELTGRDLTVPGDPSSAAFPVIAALTTPGSNITVENVGLNPLRAGLFETLRDMGAAIEILNPRDLGGEPVADLRVRAGPLKGVTVPPERAPAMIDEYPVLAVAAACAEGVTVMRGAKELRVKESDRVAATARGLEANGVRVEEHEDGLTVHGTGGQISGGGTVATHHDHRIGMSFLVLGCAAKAAVTVDDGAMIDTSFPGFADLMNGLGAGIAAGKTP
jgi:3-phosphoshikimate 1-carboxyvinyltransferase